MITTIFLTYIIFTYFYVKQYFFSKVGKELFNGDKYDRHVFYLFSWMLLVPSVFFDNIRLVIVYDQVSRHVARYINLNFKNYTRIAYKYLVNINFNNYDLTTLTFFSLCIRHHIRDSNVDSEPLNRIINVIDNKKKELENINDHNRRTLRCNNTELLISDTLVRTEYVKDNELYNYVKNKMAILPEGSNVIVLLSGGIDSMTLAHICNELSKEDGNNKNYSMFHIDWNKRLESTIECNKLVEYFNSQDHFIPLEYVKCAIDKNDPNWDAETTKYRFQCLNFLQGRSQNPTYFVMGHVISDLVENLFMNTLYNNSKGTSYLQLFGMKELSVLNGVNIFRPLLLHTKPSSNVPHLKDNASLLDIKRRVFRRNVEDVDYDRIRQLYYQSLEICDYFDQPLTYRMFMDMPDICIQRNFDNWGERGVTLKSISHLKSLFKSKERRGFPFTIRVINKVYNIVDENTNM